MSKKIIRMRDADFEELAETYTYCIASIPDKDIYYGELFWVDGNYDLHKLLSICGSTEGIMESFQKYVDSIGEE